MTDEHAFPLVILRSGVLGESRGLPTKGLCKLPAESGRQRSGAASKYRGPSSRKRRGPQDDREFLRCVPKTISPLGTRGESRCIPTTIFSRCGAQGHLFCTRFGLGSIWQVEKQQCQSIQDEHAQGREFAIPRSGLPHQEPLSANRDEP